MERLNNELNSENAVLKRRIKQLESLSNELETEIHRMNEENKIMFSD